MKDHYSEGNSSNQRHSLHHCGKGDPSFLNSYSCQIETGNKEDAKEQIKFKPWCLDDLWRKGEKSIRIKKSTKEEADGVINYYSIKSIDFPTPKQFEAYTDADCNQ
jgi:hypothetical protein